MAETYRKEKIIKLLTSIEIKRDVYKERMKFYIDANDNHTFDFIINHYVGKLETLHEVAKMIENDFNIPLDDIKDINNIVGDVSLSS